MSLPTIIKQLSQRVAELEARLSSLEGKAVERKKPGPKPKDKDAGREERTQLN